MKTNINQKLLKSIIVIYNYYNLFKTLKIFTTETIKFNTYYNINKDFSLKKKHNKKIKYFVTKIFRFIIINVGKYV